MQKVFYGEPKKKWEIADFGAREMIVMGSLAFVIIWLGLFPGSVFNTTRHTVREVMEKIHTPCAMPQNASR